MTNSQFILHITTLCSEIYNHREAKSIAYILAEEILNVTKIDIILNPNNQIDSRVDIQELSKRLESGEPVQYILGTAQFCDSEFEIGKGVLIPRHETEELIDWIMTSSKIVSPINILDVGTGSGCIAITLAKKILNSTVTAIDVEPNAINWAKRNIKKHNLSSITIIQQDALAPINEWSKVVTEVPFDIVVSNPPYIPQNDIESMDLNVKGYEPHSALFVPESDPLLFYRSIALSAQTLLSSGGELYFEIYESFSSALVSLLYDLGYTQIEIKEDINSKPRMCRCVKK